MDTALPQKFPFILDRNLAKANCTGNRVCTSCDTVVLGLDSYLRFQQMNGNFLCCFSRLQHWKSDNLLSCLIRPVCFLWVEFWVTKPYFLSECVYFSRLQIHLVFYAKSNFIKKKKKKKKSPKLRNVRTLDIFLC